MSLGKLRNHALTTVKHGCGFKYITLSFQDTSMQTLSQSIPPVSHRANVPTRINRSQPVLRLIAILQYHRSRTSSTQDTVKEALRFQVRLCEKKHTATDRSRTRTQFCTLMMSVPFSRIYEHYHIISGIIDSFGVLR